jgi:hypothetical protein
MKRLVVLVPSRGRPDNIKRLQESWIETCTHGAQLITYVDLDDPCLAEYESLRSKYFPIFTGPRKRFIGTLNMAAQAWMDRADILGSIGDDHVPRTKGWDGAVIRALESNPGIAYTNDLFQMGNLPTAAYISKEIIQALGYMAPPSFVHLYCDNFWRELGLATDSLTYLPDQIVEHMHPFCGKALRDDIYEDANNASADQADLLAFKQYLSGQFPIDVNLVRLALHK